MSTNPPSSPPYLEQYRAYLQDVGNIGTRYATSNGFYLSIVTALLGVLALSQAGAPSNLQLLLRITVPFFAVAICWIWAKTLRFYKHLFKAKFDVLREIEVAGGLFPGMKREAELFTESKGQWLTKNERRVPILLALPFVVVLIHALWALATAP